MNGSFPAECLALATGLFPKHAPSDADVRRAAKLPQKLQAQIRAFLKDEEAQPWEAWKRPPSQADMRRDLVTPFELRDVEGITIGHELLAVYLMAVNSVKRQLSDRWPIYESEGLEPGTYDLADDEYGDLWELIRALDGIDEFFADLRSHVLSREQVDAFAAAYPDVYEAIQLITVDEMSELRSKKHVFTWQQEEMYRVLMSIPDESPLITAPPQQPPKPPATTGPQQDKRVNQTRTTPERIEANEAR